MSWEIVLTRALLLVWVGIGMYYMWRSHCRYGGTYFQHNPGPSGRILGNRKLRPNFALMVSVHILLGGLILLAELFVQWLERRRKQRRGR